jgi:hypothetical protein
VIGRGRGVALAGVVVVAGVVAWAYVIPGSATPFSCSGGKFSRCRAVSGRVIHVQAVDPDGDGDAHIVLASRQSLTLPGISVLKVDERHRPAQLPGFGQWVTAIGYLYAGSHDEDNLWVLGMR